MQGSVQLTPVCPAPCRKTRTISSLSSWCGREWEEEEEEEGAEEEEEGEVEAGSKTEE